MLGVLVAPYARPTAPASSRKMGCSSPKVLAASLLADGSEPCLPWAAELMASHATPWAAYFLAVLLSDPFLCEAFTKGHPGLNHSSTTTLPRNDASDTSRPSRSLSVKSGAALPTAADPAAGAVGVVGVTAAATRAHCDEGTDGVDTSLVRSREQPARATTSAAIPIDRAENPR